MLTVSAQANNVGLVASDMQNNFIFLGGREVQLKPYSGRKHVQVKWLMVV